MTRDTSHVTHEKDEGADKKEEEDEEEEIAGRKAWFTKVPVSPVKRRDPAAR